MATTKKKVITKKGKAPGAESLLQNELQVLFSPCTINPATSDMGFDFIVEIINPLSNRDKRLFSGRKFFVVCKHTRPGDITISSEQLSHWKKSPEPIMLLKQTDGNKLSFTWVDDSLFSTLKSNWIAQNSVKLTDKLFKNLNRAAIPKIESYLIASSSETQKEQSIPQGTFFEIRNCLKREINDFINFLETNQLQTSSTRFHEIYDRTVNSIYTISVVGPSRAGKSTLINALIKESEEISPVDTLPTTGIPFTIQPGKIKESEVVFFDGTVKKGPANVKFLRQYIDQKHNPKNAKAVKLVTVFLENENLEKGLAYCDIPGLDDVNDEIRRISKIAVYSSSAIIYLIDVSPYKYGGFSINSHHLDDLRDLAPRMERVYLVFNKVDALTKQEFDSLKKYVDRVIEENDISKFLPSPPIFVSAQQSFQRIKKKIKTIGPFDIQHLEDKLWENLLKTNRNGLYNLGGLIYEFSDELTKYSNIQRSRILESDRASNLKSSLRNVQTQLNQLSKIGEDDKNALLAWLQTYINTSVAERLQSLENQLKSVPLDQALPNSYAIQQYLENNAYYILNQIFDEVNNRLDEVFSNLNDWVRSELEQVEFIEDDARSASLDKKNINTIIRPIRDSYSQKIPKAVNALEKIFGFLGESISGFFNWLEVMFVGKNKVRENQITQIMNRARSTYFSVFDQTHSQLGSFVRIQFNFMISQLKDRTQVYIGEIKKQLNLTVDNSRDRVKIQTCLDKISTHKLNIERIKNELSTYINL
ncbi:MAG: dynamin family protein [Bacteroidia bacterium]